MPPSPAPRSLRSSEEPQALHAQARRDDQRPRPRRQAQALEHIIKCIGSTRRQQQIRIISWNIDSRGFVDKLIAAHKRGVSVRVLMADSKALETPR